MERHLRVVAGIHAGALLLSLAATLCWPAVSAAQAPTTLDQPRFAPTLSRKVRKTIGFTGGGPMPLLPPRSEALPEATAPPSTASASPASAPVLADREPAALVSIAPTGAEERVRLDDRARPLQRQSVLAATETAGNIPVAAQSPAPRPLPASNPRRAAPSERSIRKAAAEERPNTQGRSSGISPLLEEGGPLVADPALQAAAGRVPLRSRDSVSLPRLLIGSAAAAEVDGSAANETSDTAQRAEPLERDVPPTRLPRFVRMLSALQDDMARGSGAALEAQRVLLARIGDEIDAATGEQLAVPVNRRAMMRYALSGGSAQSLRAALDKVEFQSPYADFFNGTLAFTEGRADDARRHLRSLDPEVLPLTVRGPLHLALAALSADADAQAAFKHLEMARVIGAGTLVEEAALRRALLIAAELNDVDWLEPLTSRYLRRFNSSVYAGNFRRRLAAALTRMDFLEDPGGFDVLDRLLASMTPESRRQILLDLSRSAVESGRSVIGAMAAARAQIDAPETGLDRPRAALYAAAAGVVDVERLEESLATLTDMDDAELPAEDRALRQAALSLGRAIETLPPPDGNVDVEAVAASDDVDTLEPPREVGPSPEEFTALASRVDDAVSSIDDLLRRTP